MDREHGDTAEAALFVGQLVDQRADRQAFLCQQPGGADPHGNRQATTELDQPCGGSGFGRDPLPGAQGRQQFDGALRVEDVQRKQSRTVEDELTELPGAGRQHGAAWSLGQQSGHLSRARDVVQHHQDAPLGGQVAIESRPLGEPLRKIRVAHAQGPETGGERLGDVPACPGAEFGEVDEDLPAGEPLVVVVGPLAGRSGLADTGKTTEHADRAPVGVLASE